MTTIKAHAYVRDVTKLLTLVDSDSQAVGHGAKEIVDQFEALRTSSSLIDVEVSYSYLTQAISTLQTRAATLMRDKCVDKVKAIHEGRLKDLRSLVEKGELEHEDAEYERAVLFVLSNVIDAIQSLTLDQVKPGEK